jgi:teichuronic acid biosynthesis glycosyltransferase TuaG
MNTTIKHTVSVVVPAYNRSHTLADALASALNQTSPVHEILVVDDGSTDNTKELVSRYSSPPVRYIYQENKGPSAARNRGMHEATGSLIAFLDADDVWLPEKLALQLEKFIQNPLLGLCASANYSCDENLNIKGVHQICPTHPGRIRKELIVKNLFATPTVIIRKDCLDKVGGFDESISFGEDWDMWLRIVDCFPAAYIDAPLCYCRSFGDGITRSRGGKNIVDWEKIIQRNKQRSFGMYARTIGYLKAKSWFYYNCAYVYGEATDPALAERFLLQSLYTWPFFVPRRYKGVIRIFLRRLFGH